jgi:hypothetical protein
MLGQLIRTAMLPPMFMALGMLHILQQVRNVVARESHLGIGFRVLTSAFFK